MKLIELNRMKTLMEEVMNDDTLAIQICTPVISSRDTVHRDQVWTEYYIS